jgi:hypothetical protein
VRAAHPLWAVLLLGTALAVPAVAEAGPRTRARRGPGGGVAAGPTIADDPLLAVVAATPSGGRAYLPRGVFRTALILDRPMTLVGSPFGTTLDGTGLGLPGVRVLSGVADVSLQGLRVENADQDGVLAEGGNHRLQLRSVTLLHNGGDGARVVDAAGVVVDRCRLEANAGDGLDASGPALRATRLVVRRNGGAGVVVRGFQGQVTDGSFEGGADGVRLEGERGVARRNAFRDVRVAGRFGATSDTCSFERNDVRGGVSALLADPGSIYGTASGNRVRGVSGDAFGLSGTWHSVLSNDVERAAGAGVDGDGSSFRVQGNDVKDAGLGISLRGTGNMVDSNEVEGAKGPSLAVEGDGNVVALNRTSGGADGILLAGSMNRAVSNVVEDARGEGLVLSGDANTLQGNVLHATAGNGIRVAAGVANYLVANSIVGCGDRGFVDAGSGTVLERNRIE